MDMIIFLLVLSVLILVHEWGHFITAKKLGVTVEQFALGFGKKLFSFVRNGTEFRLCAIPLGGYVKMAGDERSQCKGAPGEFFSKSVSHRALIVLMGPVVNIIFAYLCFWVVFMTGYVDMDLSAKKVNAQVGEILKGSPAEKAGLHINDKIIRIDDQQINHWPDMQDYVTSSTGSELRFLVEREGGQLTIPIVPKEYKQKDIFGKEHATRRIGVTPVKIKSADDVVVVRYGPLEALVKAAQELWDVTLKTYRGLYEMAIGLRSPKEAMGIVGIFFVIKYATSIGFAFLLHIVGVISASLAIFNLLPIIPLDGGHLLLLGIEKIRRKAIAPKVEDGVMRVGFSLIIMLAVFVFYVDFERIGVIDKLTNFWHHLAP